MAALITVGSGSDGLADGLGRSPRIQFREAGRSSQIFAFHWAPSLQRSSAGPCGAGQLWGGTGVDHWLRWRGSRRRRSTPAVWSTAAGASVESDAFPRWVVLYQRKLPSEGRLSFVHVGGVLVFIFRISLFRGRVPLILLSSPVVGAGVRIVTSVIQSVTIRIGAMGVRFWRGGWTGCRRASWVEEESILFQRAGWPAGPPHPP